MADDEPGRPEPDKPTQEHPGPLDDATELHPRLPPPSDPYIDDTQVTPAAEDPYYDSGHTGYPAEGYSDAPTERWSGRAGVPPAGSREWVEEEPEPPQRRRSILPVLFTVVLVALLALLGFGIWLALGNNNRSPAPGPSPTQTSSPTPTPTRTASPTPSPTASPSPALVTLLNLAGVGYNDAVALLQSKGLVPARVDQVNSSVPAGTVISTDPKGPAMVPAGSTVTLYVAIPPPTSPPPSPTVSPSR